MKNNYCFYVTIIFYFLLLPFSLNAQVYNGNLTLTSQSEIDTFNYTTVNGSLQVSQQGNDTIRNLDGLSELVSVKRLGIISNPGLNNIDGLSSLQSVLDIIMLDNPSLKNLNGFSGVTEINSLEITNNDSLENIDSVKNITHIGEMVTITGNDMLKDVNGLSGLKRLTGTSSVRITDNQRIRNLDGLINLEIINILEVSGNASLQNTNGLTKLTMGTVFIVNNDSLRSISLPALTDVFTFAANDNDMLELLSAPFMQRGSDITISGNKLLTSILFGALGSQISGLNILNNNVLQNLDGLSGIARFSGTIKNNKSLKNVSGLSNAARIIVEIENNDSLQNINGLSNANEVALMLNNNPFINNINLSSARTIYSLWIENTPHIKNLDPLINITTLGTLTLIDNDSLSNIDALSKASVSGYIRIENNNMLTDIDGLINLQLSGNLIIKRNEMLQNINGLSNLSRAEGYITISDNTSLTEFCGLYKLITYGQIPDTLQGNAVNPSPQDILDGGQCFKTSRSFIAALTGMNEVPPVITEGSGGGMFLLNTSQDTLKFWIRLCELHCPFTNAYFYKGAEGICGIPVKTLTPFFTGDSGNMFAQGVWTASDNEPLTPALVEDMIAGNIYLNIITTGHPSGEIRGQLTFDKPVMLYANLDSYQVVPPSGTGGTATGRFLLNGDGTSLDYAFTENLPGIRRRAVGTFHVAPVGENGPATGPNYTWGIVFDTAAGSWKNTDPSPLTPELVADLLGCYIYTQIIEYAFPDSNSNEAIEAHVRGQIYKTEELQTKYMTIWAAENHTDPEKFSKLSYYSLSEGEPFKNTEGEITGYNGQKNIVDMTFDNGGNIYFLNNTWTSMIYRIKPDQVDFNPSTSVYAKQTGRTKTEDGSYVWLTNIRFIKGQLYGFDNKTNKLYSINPYNASVKELAVLDAAGFKAAGIEAGADGEVYLLKNTGDTGSELWRFNSFPSADLSLVTSIPSPGKLSSISAHPNGMLYASDSDNLYEINVKEKTIGVLKDHKVSIAAMDFYLFAEKNAAASGTIPFTSLNGVTAVGDFTEVPRIYELAQNYPNPFNPNTTIKYALPEASHVRLVVYNALGEAVKTLVNENRNPGYYEIVFDAKGLASGMYIYRIEAGRFVSTAKMMLLK